MEVTTSAPHGTTARTSSVARGANQINDNRAMRERFGELMASEKRFGVLAIGIDDFDRVNNLYSYAFGDEVLDTLNYFIDIRTPPQRTYRFDGDCFGIILPDTSDTEALLSLFNSLLEFTSSGFAIDGTAVSFKISGGICLYPDNGDSADELYRNLRIALSDAKRTGGSCTVCTPSLCADSRKALLLMETLQRCISASFRGFSARFQPVADADTGEIHGCEVLMRWGDELFPEGVTPFEFIPYLEESGLITAATTWLMDVAFEQARQWIDIDPAFIMNINISKYTLEDPLFRFHIVKAAKKHRVDPHHIMLELTESGMITDAEGLDDTFAFLRSQGFGVAFDDFGTGYASLNLFRVIAADELKIDRSFLERITYDVNDQRIVASIISLCHSMNLKVCVEGVETREVLDLVRTLGADLIQGYLYDQPLSAPVFEQKYLAPLDVREAAAASQPSIVYAKAQPVQPLPPSELIDRAYAGVFQVAMDENFSFITCNEGYRRMLGYTAPEIEEKLGNRALAIVHPDDTEYVNEEIRRQLGQGDTVLIEFRVVRADGQSLWITGTGSVVRPKTGTPYLVVVIMDTDRIKRANLETEKNLKIAGHILENAPIAIKCIAYDNQFTIKYLSPEFLTIIGYTREEVRERFDNRYVSLVHPDDIAPAVATVQEKARPGHAFDLCYRVRAGNGSMLWLSTKTKLCEANEDGSSDFVSVVVEVEGPDAQSESLLLANRFQTASERWGDILFNLYLKTDTIEFTDNYEEEFDAPPKHSLPEQLALSPASDRTAVAEAIEEAKRGIVPAPLEIRLSPRDDGEYVWCALSLNCAETSEGEPSTIFGRLRNVDSEKRKRDELVHESQSDPLCDVYNKITIERKIQEVLDNAQPDACFAFAVIDIDNFKTVNDTAGHLTGDQMLVFVAEVLKSSVSDEGLVGRIGGDEFVVLQPCEAAVGDALAFGTGIIERIDRTCSSEESDVTLQTSAGVACFPDDGTTFYSLFKCADAALYLAKEQGKNRACLYGG
ncbi:EAL domain-containing protein [Raoultibacter phocaeensis]|uniref:EAL domain-containing protein n=1 Tax=Raoultibacter phocaeensis TaxID=2479841 RepID=UPI0015D5B5C5|nr:EAL domain-containing protein [Raoultibacter phocaeensis]